MLTAGLTLVLLLAGQATPASQSDAGPGAGPRRRRNASHPPSRSTDPAAIAANLADMYEKSCGGRIYGTYAEACNGLARVAEAGPRGRSQGLSARKAARLK